MDHELFGNLRYNKTDQLWSGSTTLRQFANFGATRCNDDEERRRREGILPLSIRDPAAAGPTSQQQTAFRFLRDNEADVFRAALGALFQSYQEYTASPISGFWEWVGGLFGVKPIESPDALAAQANFTELEISAESKDDLAYLLFHVNCDWEPEHGMMIVYHKDRPAEWTTPDALELS
jgi:Domain of unknown function (DUF6985)